MTLFGSPDHDTDPIPFLDLTGVNDEVRKHLDAAWESVLGHGWFVSGPEVAQFESEFAEYCGAVDAVGVGNGTDALELILAGLGIGPGDEVLVPTNTFVATAEAVCSVGARPRFIDVLPDTLLLDPDAAAAAVTSRTAAIIAVHLFGQPVEIDRVGAIARRHGLALVEDAAQAHGASYAGRRTGSLADVAAFSFYPGKNLGAIGDGGAVVSNDADLLARIRGLADHGRCRDNRGLHTARGRNSRLDTLQAAALLAKLRELDDANARRAAAMDRYRARLPADVLPVTTRDAARSVYHLAVVQVEDRSAATARLDAAGVGWGVHYPIPCHRQPAFAEFAEGPLPVAERAADRILSLPMSPTITTSQIDRVCATLS